MKTLLISLCIAKLVSSTPPLTKVEEGELIGKEYVLQNGKIINAFLGIPYAAPPISDYRFQAPQKLKPWRGVWNATFYRNSCLQLNHRPRIIYQIEGSEDCLYLNIFAPKLNTTNNLLNVLVVIHGGAFSHGSGKLFPDHLLGNNDIIFVTMNYRLGIFGFLSTDDSQAPGNFGLKDQVQALRWVKKNIVNFGGDPDKVTIFGHSAGGSSVHYHMISPSTEGLFQKAISLSGTIGPPWTLSRDTIEKSFHLAAQIGCSIQNTTVMMKCMRQKSSIEIIEGVRKYIMMWIYLPITPFTPIEEPPSLNAFLSEDSMNLLKKGEVKDIPWIYSTVKDEAIIITAEYLISDLYLKELNENWYKFAPVLLYYNNIRPENERDRISSVIKHFCWGDKPITKETVMDLAPCIAGRLLYDGLIKSTKLHNLATKANIYCYKFNHPTERSMLNFITGSTVHYGVSHGDDYLLVMNGFPNDKITNQSDLAVSNLLVSAIIEFMNYGSPNRVVPFWEPVTKNLNSDVNCLTINSATDFKMENIPITSPNLEFWRNILPQEQKIGEKNLSPRCYALKLLLVLQFLLCLYIFE